MNKIVFAFLTGTVLGILFAPQKGSVLRQTLAEGFDDLKSSFRDGFNELYAEEMNRQHETEQLYNIHA